MLNLPVHEPARPGPAHLLVGAAPYAENRSAGMATTYLIVIRQANAFLPGLAPAWRPRHQAVLEAFMADCSPSDGQHRRHLHKTLKIHLRLQHGPICDHRHPLPTTLLSGSTRGALLPSEEWSREYCPR
jgi:hypothetical protein